MFVWIILIVLFIVLIGAVPAWPHSRRWGYSPTAIIALVLIVFLCIWAFGGMSSYRHHGWWGGNHMMNTPQHMAP